ncbi:MAG: HAD-IIB family hydrolase [Tateyamaria sp.]|uniref:HAD-IIB family hydrolase n=2 Tax=Tateyamaria sp. TaxID=1929288 RepID=UPI00329B57E5
MSSLGLVINRPMKSALPLLVFSDLDGTLIDHHSYAWAAAAPALAALKQIGAGVVLASSKTAVEIDTLRHAMGLQDWPAIVENGAGLLAAHTDVDAETGRYTDLRAILDTLPSQLRSQYVGFGDLSVQAVTDLTGLSPDAAAMAKQRAFSEPGTWHGTLDAKQAFLAALADLGVQAQQGGRFLTLSFGASKADHVHKLAAQLRPKTTLALGDAPNDIKMLEACDFGVVIANPNADPLPHLTGEDDGRITRTTHAGPQGWNRAVLQLLERLDLI